MDIIINELYNGNIRPIEQMGSLTPEAKVILKEENVSVKPLHWGRDWRRRYSQGNLVYRGNEL